MAPKFNLLFFLILSALLGMQSSAEAQAHDRNLVKELGLKNGESYASAKAKLIKRGWIIDIAYVEEMKLLETPPYGFREVICGNGWDASCSARYRCEGQAIMLTMRPKKTLVVDGAWDDK
jgi:hypothetical protein